MPTADPAPIQPGTQVDWNPTGDIWLHAEVLEVTDVQARIALGQDSPGQRLVVERRHLRLTDRHG